MSISIRALWSKVWNGIEAGTVSPIPTIPGVRVLLDQRLPSDLPLFTGSGQPGQTLEITLPELLRITEGSLVDVVSDSAG
jgi:prolyl-tRNA editing enzyme YbaK/EbsC (Cys-tRNA(Pro) deacylase)